MTGMPPDRRQLVEQFLRGETDVVEPRDAATVVLLRDGATGPEVYLLRRRSTMAFAAGMHVFPGGAVDPRDRDGGARWVGPSPAAWAEAFTCEPGLAGALVCAAVRETFEESGVLLAAHEDGTPVTDTTGEDWERDRLALIDGELALSDFLARRSLVVRADLLRPWAHWITPEWQTRRFDTRFFLAALPAGQRTRDVGGEADRVTWLPVHRGVRGVPLRLADPHERDRVHPPRPLRPRGRGLRDGRGAADPAGPRSPGAHRRPAGVRLRRRARPRAPVRARRAPRPAGAMRDAGRGAGGHVYLSRALTPAAMDAARALSLPLVVHDDPDRPPSRDRLLADARGATALITLLTERVDRELLDAAGPGLRIVANCAVGYDNVDVAAAAERGIVVTNTPGVLDEATADVAFGLVLAASRRLVEADRFMRTGRDWIWGPQLFLGLDVSAGATLGIVGLGRIGLAVARRAAAFDLRILATGRRAAGEEARALGVEPADLPRLLADSDVVSLHCPLTPETRHLIGAAQLAAMKPTAILVNTARGPIVDEAALVEALRDRADRRRRPRRLRGRAAPAPRPARAGERGPAAAPGQRRARHPRRDGHARRRQRPRRPPGGAAAHAGVTAHRVPVRSGSAGAGPARR